MEALQISSQDWYSLREHLDDITKEYVRFKFVESNAPDITSGVFEYLKKHFQSITIDRPIEPAPPYLSATPYIQEFQSSGWLYITLHFKEEQSRMITNEFIGKLTQTINP